MFHLSERGVCAPVYLCGDQCQLAILWGQLCKARTVSDSTCSGFLFLSSHRAALHGSNDPVLAPPPPNHHVCVCRASLPEIPLQRDPQSCNSNSDTARPKTHFLLVLQSLSFVFKVLLKFWIMFFPPTGKTSVKSSPMRKPHVTVVLSQIYSSKLICMNLTRWCGRNKPQSQNVHLYRTFLETTPSLCSVHKGNSFQNINQTLNSLYHRQLMKGR